MAGDNKGPKPQASSGSNGANKIPSAAGGAKNIASNAAMKAMKNKMGGAGSDMKGAVKKQAIDGAKSGADSKEQVKAMGKQAVTKMASKALEASYHVPTKVSEPIIEKVVDKVAANPQVDKIIEQAGEKVEKVKKKKGLILIGGAVAPILLPILGLVITVAITLLPLLLIAEFLGEITEFGDKAINFVTTGSWASSENLFFDTLEKQYNRYNTYKNKEGYFDSPLIAATVHYNYIMDPDSYTEEANDEETSDTDDEELNESLNSDDTEYIPKTQSGGFYVWANDQLGSAFTLIPSQKKLIGHMINTKLTTKCVALDDTDLLFKTFWETVQDFFNHFAQTTEETTIDIVQFLNILNTLRNIIAYAGQDDNYYIAQFENLGYEALNDNDISELIDFFKNSDLTLCPMGQWTIPVLTKYIDYEEYDKYLREFYVPRNVLHYTGIYATFTDVQKREIERAIKEIYDQRDGYCEVGHCLTDEVAISGFTGNVVFPIDISSGRNWTDYVTGYFGVTNGTWSSGHSGIDFGANVTEGQPIYSVADGTVVWLQDGQNSNIGSSGSLSYGNAVKIGYDVDKNGQYDYYIIYAHMRSVSVSMNEMVGGGQKIGELGNTGNSYGAHLHFELRDANNTPINPYDLLNAIFNKLPSALNPDDNEVT